METNSLGDNTAYVQRMYSVAMDKSFGLHAHRVAKMAQMKTDQNKRAKLLLGNEERMPSGRFRGKAPTLEDFGGDTQWDSKARESKVNPKKHNTSKRSAYWYQYERAREDFKNHKPSPYGIVDRMDMKGEWENPWAPYLPQ